MGRDQEIHANMDHFFLAAKKETCHEMTSWLQKGLYVVDRVTRVRIVYWHPDRQSRHRGDYTRADPGGNAMPVSWSDVSAMRRAMLNNLLVTRASQRPNVSSINTPCVRQEESTLRHLSHRGKHLVPTYDYRSLWWSLSHRGAARDRMAGWGWGVLLPVPLNYTLAWL